MTSHRSAVKQVTPSQVKARLDQGETIRLIDVREPNEHAIAHIEGAELMPLSRAQSWINTLSPDEEIVVFCHMGGRSQQVAQYLVNQLGFTNVANMVGGIDDWSLQVDPNVPRY
jgi:rhodanese-related sulfurtransferase